MSLSVHDHSVMCLHKDHDIHHLQRGQPMSSYRSACVVLLCLIQGIGSWNFVTIFIISKHGKSRDEKEKKKGAN